MSLKYYPQRTDVKYPHIILFDRSLFMYQINLMQYVDNIPLFFKQIDVKMGDHMQHPKYIITKNKR